MIFELFSSACLFTGMVVVLLAGAYFLLSLLLSLKKGKGK